MSQVWAFRSRWMVDASILHRKAVTNTCWTNIQDMCNILDHAYEYMLPEEKEEFDAWQELYGPPCETTQGIPDAETEHPAEQETNFQEAYEAIMEDAALDGLGELGDAIQGSMFSRASPHDINASQDTMNSSDGESSTLEDVFQLEEGEDYGEKEADTDPDSSFLWEDVDSSLDNGSQLEEDGIALDTTSQSDDEYLPSDSTPQMDDWTSTLTDEASDISIPSEDDCPDLDVPPHTEEENSTPDIAPQSGDESPASDDAPQQRLIIPLETSWDRMPGLLKEKLESNAVFEHILTMMNQPSLKPHVRRTQPVPQDFQDTYDKALIRIGELKSLWHCVRETERYILIMKTNYEHAKGDLDDRAKAYRRHSRRAPDFKLQIMKSRGQASRLNECIGIDEPWPEGE